jgi:ParB family transcriptional regulator, chromosome partitioning protein
LLHGNFQHVPIDLIRVESQVRTTMDEKSFEGLVASIREHGVIVPIVTAFDGQGHRVVDGHRRVKAATHVGLATIPAVVQDAPLSQSQIIAIQLTTAWQREDLSPMDRAVALRELMDQTGMTAGQAGAKLGVSAGTVCRHLRLLKLPGALRDRVAAGEIPASAGYQLARVGDVDAQAALAAEVAAGDLTRNQLVRKAKARPVSRSRLAAITRVVMPLGDRRSVVAAGPGATIDTLISWLEECLARVRELRTRGTNLADLRKVLTAQVKRG